MSEVRALLLTDVVDSTKLAESIGDAAMAALWSAHDRAARDLLVRHRGREIDKTDGMLMLFEVPSDALAFAQAYHRALAALPTPIEARAGLHVGAVTLRWNSAADVALGAKPLEVEGLAKPIAARVMALACGGQTLMTAEALAALGSGDRHVESHGFWMIKGLAEPIELFEVVDPDAPAVAPSDGDKAYRVVQERDWWLPVREIPNNLPHLATSFVGREQELAQLKSCFDHGRLLTLLGMGGMGKTRLAVQAAAGLLHRFADGVWFVDLAPLRDPALVTAAAAQVLGVKAEPDRTLLQSIGSHLADKRVLLVLDNCEHLVKPAAELADAVLLATARVCILATSREPLHIPAERCFPLHPLPLPAKSGTADAIGRSAAVQLFVERARQVKQTFALDARQSAAVAELVQRLDGVPLALELAAARVRSMSVADINARLNDRYKILTGGSRVLHERQQTLRALVDWSYDLLGEQEQGLFARLGVFVGGFDLAAAESVCGVAPLGADDVLDLLGSLVDKSLIVADDTGETTRYRMLETIRDYAREKLVGRQEDGEIARLHCEHFFALAKHARDGIRGPNPAEWIQRLEVDLDNVRAAIALALAGGVDPFIAVKIANAVQTFWLLRGYATEGRAIVRRALSVPAIGASELAQSWALYVGAVLAETQGDLAEARQMLERCLQLRRRLGNRVDIAATLSTLSLVRLRTGDTAGAEQGELEALQIFRDIGHKQGEAIGLLHLGQICQRGERGDEARGYLRKSLSLAHEIGHQEVEGESQLVIGEMALDDGDLAEAELWLKRSLTVCREAGDKRGEANATRWLGRCDLRRGSIATARSRLSEALRSYAAFEMWEELLGCLEDAAELQALDGRETDATRLLAAVDQARGRLALHHGARASAVLRDRIDALRRTLGPDFEAHWQDGSRLEIREAVEQALAPLSEAFAAT